MLAPRSSANSREKTAARTTFVARIVQYTSDFSTDPNQRTSTYQEAIDLLETNNRTIAPTIPVTTNRPLLGLEKRIPLV
jgi:hypothetical protein